MNCHMFFKFQKAPLHYFGAFSQATLLCGSFQTNLRIRLYAGTVPANKEYAAGKKPTNKKNASGTVPANKKYAAGTLNQTQGKVLRSG